MMKKVCSILLSSSIILGLLSGCGQTAGRQTEMTEATEEVTLTVVGPWPECSAIDTMAAMFNETYPNCHVVYEYIQDYDDNLLKRLSASDNKVDMFLTNNIQKGSELMQYALDFSSVGDLVDLSGTYEGLIDNAKLQSSVEADKEKIYSVPLGAEVRGMFVNTTLLDSLDISVPTNRQEFLDACETLFKAGYTPLQGNPGMFGQQFLYPYICNLVANADDYETTYATVNNHTVGVSELFWDPVQFLYSLVENGYYNYKYSEVELGLFADASNEGYARDFMSIVTDESGDYVKKDDVGQIAFMPSTESISSIIQKTKEDYHSEINYQFILSPVGENGGYAYMSPGRSIAAYNGSDHMDWALKFINYIFQPEQNKILCREMGFVPNTTDALDMIKTQFNIPENHISQLGQVTFDYDFFTVINTTLIDISKGNNPKYMKTDEDGKSVMYPLGYYLEQFEANFQAVE